MSDEVVKQVIVVSQDEQLPDAIYERIAFFNADGSVYEGLPTDAAGVTYDNEDSGLEADRVQAAIDEVSGKVDDQSTAAGVSYDGEESELEATDTQAAIDELKSNADDEETARLAIGAKLPALVTTATIVGTAAKITASEEPPAGSIVPIKFTHGNSADAVTVAFNGGAARAVQLAGVAVDADQLTLADNAVAVFYFDGAILHQMGLYSQV